MNRFTSNSFASAIRRSLSICALAATIAFAHTTTHAAVLAAESEGYGVSADVSAVSSILTIQVLPTAQATGAAPSPYDDSETAINLDASAGVALPPLTTVQLGALSGTLSGAASSDVDGSAGPKTADGSALVEGLSIDLGTLQVLGIGDAAVSISATTIDSTANVSGEYGSLTRSGDSTLVDLSISLFGAAPIDLTGIIDANGKVAPNTTLGLDVLGVAGIEIILNEQIETGDLVGFAGIEVNALHIKLNAFDGGIANLGLLNADIIVAHSDAFMTAQAAEVPQPASAAMAGVGTLLLAVRRRRRRM